MTSVREIVDAIVAIVGPTPGSPVFGTLPVRPLEQRVDVDGDETERVLGWRAGTGLEDGLRRTVEWFRNKSSAPRNPLLG
jgi:nucleoside-diphosphate-sugar epimerase